MTNSNALGNCCRLLGLLTSSNHPTTMHTVTACVKNHRCMQAGPGQPLQPAVREMLTAPVFLPSQYLQKSAAAFEVVFVGKQIERASGTVDLPHKHSHSSMLIILNAKRLGTGAFKEINSSTPHSLDAHNCMTSFSFSNSAEGF